MVFALFRPSGSVQGAILVSNLVFDLQVQAGESTTFSFDVSNSGDVAENVTVTYYDWELDAQANHLFLPPNSVERGLADWMTFSPSVFRLGPNESQQVRMTVTGPPDGGTHWGLLMVESEDRPTQPGEGGVGIQIKTRFGIKVYATDPGTMQLAGQVARIDVARPTETTPLTLSLEFLNMGNTKLAPTGWFEIRDSRGAAVWRSNFEMTTILPDARGRVSRAYDGAALTPGRYVLIGVADYGGDRLVARQVALDIQ